MRTILFLALAIILTGCGTTAAGSGQATATPVGQWSHSPPMTINPAHGYTAALTTSDGVIRVQLLPKIAPVTVNNFVFLARHRFYDGLLFHRIVKGFVVQTGDPTGTGLGGPGYHFKNEKVTLKYTPGTLAMANSGVNMNGSQFFIVTGTAAQKILGPSYTIFGHVIQGMNVVQKLNNTPVQPNVATGELSSPMHDVYLKSVTIQESA